MYENLLRDTIAVNNTNTGSNNDFQEVGTRSITNGQCYSERGRKNRIDLDTKTR